MSYNAPGFTARKKGKRKMPPGGDATAASSPVDDDLGRVMSGYTDYRFYGEQRYWESRYAADGVDVGGNRFEWFADPEQLMPLLDMLVPDRDGTVIDLGCGTSGVLDAMRASGYTGRLVGVDYSADAIDGCKAKANGGAKKAKPSTSLQPIEYVTADFTDLSTIFPRDGEVPTIVEKATINGLVSSPDGPALVAQMLTEVHRLLADDGLFISFSGSDPNDQNEAKNGMNVLEEIVLPPLIEAAEESGHYWLADVHSSESFGEIYAYVLRKRLRARTRAAARGEPIETVVKCHDH